MKSPTIAEIDRVLDLNRFLIRHYWHERSLRLVGQCVMHAKLLWMRAQVELRDLERAR
jgi:hypothetical protein